MSTTETETNAEEQDLFAPAADLEDLFSEEDDAQVEDDDLSSPTDQLTEEELRQKVAALSKKAEFERKQRVESDRKRWIAEAKEHFPYATPEKINADSRRAFLKEAKAQDDDFRERAKSLLESNTKTREEVEAELREKLEAEYKGAWGTPTVGSGGVPIEEAEVNKRVEDSRRRRDLKGVTKALMDGRII